MPTSLPPLTALKAFEAAACHLSLKKAAEEMNVTPAAVSHQIQQLEDLLGVRLFRRVHRGIELTEVAQACIPKLQEGFDCLRQAVDRVHEHRGTEILTVGVAPSFASLWLMPRLHHFVTSHPYIDVRVSTRMRQFSRMARTQRIEIEVLGWADEVDVVVVFGSGDYPGMSVDRLLQLSVTPLCSPALLHGAKPLRKPELAVTDLVSGRLVAPFDLRVPLASSYYVVSNALSSKRGIVGIFRKWLLEEADREVGAAVRKRKPHAAKAA